MSAGEGAGRLNTVLGGDSAAKIDALVCAATMLPTKLPEGQAWYEHDFRTLTPAAQALVLAYNDLGIVPRVSEGAIVGIRWKDRTPMYEEGELT